MFRNLLFLFFFSFIAPMGVRAQRSEAILQYIDQFDSIAIAEMQRTGVPASIKLAQGIQETQAGVSPLVQRSNNHFGIKCKSGWTGPSVRHDDDERAECFRKYETPEASYIDHSDFLMSNSRYSSLFKLPPTDYSGWAWGLKKAGYATSPSYAQALIKLIEDYDLNRYALLAMGSFSDSSFAADTVAVSAIPIAAGAETVSASPGRTVAESPSLSKESVQEIAYPSGIFTQAGYRATWVKAGTPFLSIAQRYHIPLAKLFAFNDMAPAVEASQDQVLYLERRVGSVSLWPPGTKK